MENIPFDNFTINLDVSRKVEWSTGFLFNMLLDNVRNNIHIINYTSLDLDKLINKYNSDFNKDEPDIRQKIVIAKDIPMNFVSLETYAENLSVDDYLFIIGGERLISFSKTSSIISTKFNGRNANLHFMDYENWGVFVDEIDKLYGDMQKSLQGIFFNICVDIKSRDLFLELSEESGNFSITCIELSNQNEDYEKLQRELFEKFEGSSLSEIINLLESNKSKLEDNTYRYMKALAYMHQGNISEAKKILESNYENLRNEEKLILADLLTTINEKERAKEILDELFQSDKYHKGLLQAILRLNEDSDNLTKKKWIDISLKLDPLNPVIKEYHGNWLSNNGDYLGAAKVFREIRDIMDFSPYYELVARINDLLDASPKSTEAQSYIFSIIDENPKLKNEANYRLSKFLIDHKNSYFTAYSVLKQSDMEIGEPRTIEIAKLKFEILTDVVKGSEALRKLKPFKRERDANLLRDERAETLLKCIPVLATSFTGYLSWRAFISDSQLDDNWKESMFIQLKEKILKVPIDNFDDKLDHSYIKKIEDRWNSSKVYEGLKLLRKIKSGEFLIEGNFKDLDEFINVILTVSELYGDIPSQLWSRYYLSVILSQKGETQLANNIALSIFEYYPRVKDKKIKSLSIYLGLTAWGNSQYRIGREVEGIACIISTLQLAQQLNEFVPFVEEGVNIVARFLSDNKKIINKDDKYLINNFVNSFNSYNNSIGHVLHFINGTSDSIINDLENDVKLAKTKDLGWGGKVVNLVSAYMENERADAAIRLLEEYGDKALEKLSGRIDLRYKVILNWAQIYFFHVSNENAIKKAITLLEKGMEDIEHRRSVHHKEERASVGKASEDIYRFYIQLCSLLFGIGGISSNDRILMQEKIESVLPKMNPRSIIEQKKYNITKEITLEMEELVRRKSILTEEYNSLFEKNRTNFELINDKAKEIEIITNKLIDMHPYYKPLPNHETINFKNIQSLLGEKEVFYQYIVTPMTVITLLITKESIELKTKLISLDSEDIIELSKQFSYLIQDDDNHDKEIENLTHNISRAIADELINHIKLKEISRVYLMQDFKMGLFPILITNIDDSYIIDRVESIINIIDYTLIGDKHSLEKDFFSVANRIIGKPTDISLKTINEWLITKKDNDFIVLDNNSDDTSNLSELASSDYVNTVIVYGHGVTDPKASPIDGAQGIEGQKGLIRLDEIVNKLQNVENLILISCRGGSPYSESPENSTGTWANMLEGFNGNIISCKWDVPTKSSVFIVDEIINQIKHKKVSIDKAVINAQKKAKLKYDNPMYWAGIEFWKN